MIRILFPRDISVHAESTFKYFLALSDEVEADVSVLKKETGSKSGIGWEGLKSRLAFRQAPGALQQAIRATELYPYDLALAGNTKNVTWWDGSHLFPAAHLAKRACCPVMLIPEKTQFKPIRNILFVDCQEEMEVRPLLRKLSYYWAQNHYCFPCDRRRYGYKGSPFSRFDETGYRLSPGILGSGLESYIKGMAIDLLVLDARNAGAGWEVLSFLSVPALIFNTQNINGKNTTGEAGLGNIFGKEIYSKKARLK